MWPFTKDQYASEPESKPLPTDLASLLDELEETFSNNPHWTGDGPITRPIVLMARTIAEMERIRTEQGWTIVALRQEIAALKEKLNPRQEGS